MTTVNFLPANEVKKIVSDFEPNYILKTVIVEGTEMVSVTEIENLLTLEQFKHLMSQF